MTTITIKIDDRNKTAQAFINYIKALPFIKIQDKSEIRYNAKTERAIRDIESGKTHKVKNSEQFFKELGI